MNRILILFAASMLFWSGVASAQCINPAATEGEIIYNTDYGVHQYCNGSAWMAFWALNPGAGGSGCNVPTGIAGDLMYNSAYHVLQYCDGDDWRAVGGTVVGLSGPVDCPAIGDKCTDTTIFVGFHPLAGKHLFIPPTDTGTTMAWKTSTGNDIANVSSIDGKFNASQITISTTFPAFKACDDLTLAGKSWYLPSLEELSLLSAVSPVLRAKRPGNGFINFQSSFYWSSTEYYTSHSWLQNFSNGLHDTAVKTNAYGVRCMAR